MDSVSLLLLFLFGSTFTGSDADSLRVSDARSWLTSDDEYGPGSGDGLLRSVVQLKAGECVLKTNLDVVFLVDIGRTVPPPDVQYFREYVMSIIRLFDLDDQKTRVALITYGSNSLGGLEVLSLTEGNNHQAVQQSLGKFHNGYYPVQLSNGLVKSQQIFRNNPRNVEKVIFVITSTPLLGSQDLAELLRLGAVLLAERIHLYIVAVGPASSDSQLHQLGQGITGFHRTQHAFAMDSVIPKVKKQLVDRYQCDQCIPNNCPRLETCTSATGSASRCLCQLGFIDDLCEDTNPCRANPCLPGEKCIRERMSFRCADGPGDRALCANKYCANRGFCYITGGAPTCNCPVGYVGPSCEGKCQPCPPRQYCDFSNGRVVCKCLSGVGPSCDPEESPCSSVNCVNGGVCVINNIGFAYCQCQPGFNGAVCEISPCRDHSCRNGGTCVVSSQRKPFCVCPHAFTGDHCDHGVSCTNLVCSNGGYCIVNGAAAECKCPLLYHGANCERSRCLEHYTCLNGGVCGLSSQGSLPVKCHCTAEWAGETCVFRTCHDYCLNNGQCVLRGGKPSCDCAKLYAGERCERQINVVDQCVPNPCVNGGTCSQGTLAPNFFTCTCPPKFSGATCRDRTFTDLCAGIVCLNGGTCLVNANGPNCNCSPGYYGLRCENSLCSSYTCNNGGSCALKLVVNTYVPYCNCPVGFSGDRCDDIVTSNPCLANPCTAPCKCFPSKSHADGFVCESDTGLLGKACNIEKPILECGDNEIKIKLTDKLFQEYKGNLHSNAFFYMGPDENFVPPESCKASVNGPPLKLKHELSMVSPFKGKCETKEVLTSLGSRIFRNRVWYNIDSSGSLFDMPIPILVFECAYSTEYSVKTQIRPVIDTTDNYVNKTLRKRFSGNFKLCKSTGTTCNLDCPATLVVQPGDTYTIGQFITIIVQPDTSLLLPGRTVRVNSLFMSCSEDATMVPVLPIVSNGCPSEVMFAELQASGSSTCIKFQLPRSKACLNRAVYFHAQMNVCDTASLQFCSTSGSLTRCLGTSGRKRRAVADFLTGQLDQEDVFGPIYLRQSADFDMALLPDLPAFPEIPKPKSDNKSNSAFGGNLLLIAILGSVGVAAVLLTAFLLAFYRSYRRNELL